MLIPVTSTMIESIGYNDSTKVLIIKFSSNGRTYRYMDVEKSMFDNLLAATTSHGQFFNDNIKNQYTDVEVDEKDIPIWLGSKSSKSVPKKFSQMFYGLTGAAAFF